MIFLTAEFYGFRSLAVGFEDDVLRRTERGGKKTRSSIDPSEYDPRGNAEIAYRFSYQGVFHKFHPYGKSSSSSAFIRS